MNQLITQTFDKFSNRTTTISSSVVCSATYKLRFRHERSETLNVIVIDIESQNYWRDVDLLSGVLVVRINDANNYELKPERNHKNLRNCGYDPVEQRNVHEFYESVYYVIEETLLKKIADASIVELLITGGAERKILSLQNQSPSIQLLAQAMYRAIYDSMAYADIFNTLEQKQETEKEQKIARQKKLETARKTKKRRRKKQKGGNEL